MEIITDIEVVTGLNTVATIGSFDGVHKGHVAMINEARSIAQQRALSFTVITFAQHPRLLFKKVDKPFLLTSFDEKMTLLSNCGVERCILLPFDKAMATLSAREFMEQVLCKKLGVKVLAVGYDHRFGCPKHNESFLDYVRYGKEVGIDVVRMHPYSPNGENISSSAVRRMLDVGDVISANRFLGRNYSVCGNVVHGVAIGRSIGFPTANIALCEPMQMLPLDGVYECAVEINGERYLGVMNIGHKPTLGADERTVEVFIINFSGDIYDCNVRVQFVRRLREEIRFASLEELRRQIEKDVSDVLKNNNMVL